MQAKRTTINRKPLKDEVFDVLHRSILSGEYPAGAWLRQEEISRQLGVSMTPVREALDLLVSSGLAERVAYRGVRVLHLSDPDILDSYEVRLLLESSAAGMAAARITVPELHGLRELLDQGATLLKLRDLPRQREVSRALHGAIVQGCGNALLHITYLQVLKSFPDWMLYEHLYRNPTLLEESLRVEHQEHIGIVDAIAARNPGRAVQMALEHVVMRGRELERYLGISHEALAEREACARQWLGASEAPADVFDKETT
ncbi:MAG TPA: GntR family transcriptional regulator [Anaerolineales bacterium]